MSMSEDYPDSGMLATFRHEPERTSTLLKVGCAGPLHEPFGFRPPLSSQRILPPLESDTG